MAQCSTTCVVCKPHWALSGTPLWFIVPILNGSLSCSPLKDSANECLALLQPVKQKQTNKDHFKLVYCLYMEKKKKKRTLSPGNFPLVAKTETESPESQTGDKTFGAAGKGGEKTACSWKPPVADGSHRRDRSQKSPDKHMHMHIKPIWKSKWNHMWEELKQLFMFSFKFHLNCPGIFKHKFWASFSFAGVSTCAEDYFYFVVGNSW